MVICDLNKSSQRLDEYSVAKKKYIFFKYTWSVIKIDHIVYNKGKKSI